MDGVLTIYGRPKRRRLDTVLVLDGVGTGRDLSPYRDGLISKTRVVGSGRRVPHQRS